MADQRALARWRAGLKERSAEYLRAVSEALEEERRRRDAAARGYRAAADTPRRDERAISRARERSEALRQRLEAVRESARRAAVERAQALVFGQPDPGIDAVDVARGRGFDKIGQVTTTADGRIFYRSAKVSYIRRRKDGKDVRWSAGDWVELGTRGDLRSDVVRPDSALDSRSHTVTAALVEKGGPDEDLASSRASAGGAGKAKRGRGFFTAIGEAGAPDLGGPGRQVGGQRPGDVLTFGGTEAFDPSGSRSGGLSNDWRAPGGVAPRYYTGDEYNPAHFSPDRGRYNQTELKEAMYLLGYYGSSGKPESGYPSGGMAWQGQDAAAMRKLMGAANIAGVKWEDLLDQTFADLQAGAGYDSGGGGGGG